MAINTTLVDHPVVADALTRIRDRDTPNALFRQNLERIGTLLIAEATRSLPTVDGTVETPLTTAPAKRIATQPVVVPILRAGLGFVSAAQELLPNADIGFIGIARNEDTHQPEPYVNKLPESLVGRPVIVVDPMLATGGSLIHTIQLLRERGAPEPITVLCAKHHIADDVDAVLERTGATTVVCLTRREELSDRYPRYVEWLDLRTTTTAAIPALGEYDS